MPTVLRKDGFRFFFFSNEGDEPPHIHIENANGYAKFWLNPPRLSYSKGLKLKQLLKVRNFVEANQGYFNKIWNE